MRTRAFIVIAVAALALAGCGDRNLVLKVDVLSYLEASQRTYNVETVPAVGVEGEIPVLDIPISLIDGLDEAAEVKSVTLSLGGGVTVASGAGSAHLKLYLSEVGAPSRALVMDVPVTFAEGVPAVIDATTAGSQEVARLFTQKNLQLKVVLDQVNITSTVTDMTVTFTKLDAIVVAGRKAF
ncbi:MAG: hypothetical protein E4H17_00330 [Gemmatimonadales bacterium]|nr:MAG: hypothetical protein E4H17_00330 [Gemmatimonadales bacterium]